MSTQRSLKFKIASEASEFEQIFRLNYQTFVEELPQHPPNPERRLVDRFHHQNTYLIALDGDRLVGMLAVRDQRPFSLDEKLGNIDHYLPPGRSVCELRLLSVLPGYRRGVVLQGLIKRLVEYGKGQGYNLAVISGTVRQLKLYKRLSFAPFGQLVGSSEEPFQPMYLTLEAFEENAPPSLSIASPSDRARDPISFLPGPVGVSRAIKAALNEPPVSHRSDKFKEDLAHTKRFLCRLVGAPHVEIFLGSGTLANDVIAAQLSLISEPGVIVNNGEFGERLVDHADRFHLVFEALQLDWGATVKRAHVKELLDRRRTIRWLWAVACETSTGILNDVAMLKELCAERGVLLCLDCISSVGTVPVDLRGVYLASSVSGKGLGAFPGLSMVFYHHEVLPEPNKLPRYLDLGYYAAQGGIPFTHSSNLLSALQVALQRFNSPQPFNELIALSHWLRQRLRELGFHLLAPEAHASPAIVTLVLPKSISAQKVGDQLQAAGFLLHYQSQYLRERNWMQICLMGECSRAGLKLMLAELAQLGLAASAARSSPAILT